jgi:hypothetical protein
MNAHALSGSLRTVAVVVVVGAGVGVGAWMAADAVDAPLPSTPPPDVAVHVAPAEPDANDVPQAPHVPTAAEIAEAKQYWREDLEVDDGTNVVVVHYAYDVAVDPNALQAITVAWTRAVTGVVDAVDGVDGPRASVVATGTLENDRDFIEFAAHPFGDRNRNGVPDVLVRTSFVGTAWSSERLRLLEPRDGVLVDVLDVPWLQESRWPTRFEDVDDDGVVELVTADITWEFMLATGSHADGPRGTFVVKFRRGGGMAEDARSPLVAAQLIDERKAYRGAVAAGEQTAVLNAAGTILELEMNGPGHDVDGAVARYRRRIADAHLDTEHENDASAVASHARAVDAERARPPR